MSKKIKVKLNSKGIVELMKSDEVINVLNDYASDSLKKLGDGYTSDTYKGRFRANVSIGAESEKAKAENSKNNTILKAVLG